MGSKVLLELIEKPSFEGEMSMRLVEERDPEGRAKYTVVCQKKPPLNENEWAVFAALGTVAGQDLEEVAKGINWEREVPPLEAESMLAILEKQVVSLSPESVLRLDGTTYELLVERGFNKVQFTWWSEPPAGWRAIGELSKILRETADAASMIEVQQSKSRKRLIRELTDEIDEARTRLKNESAELLRRHNIRCNEIAQSLRAAGVNCPNCSGRSSDIRFVDNSPAAKSYFICQVCGRSFRPEDL